MSSSICNKSSGGGPDTYLIQEDKESVPLGSDDSAGS